MEVTEAVTGLNVEKPSNSVETVNETVEKCNESQVVNNDTPKTVSVSETDQVLPTCETETVEEIIEEVEVTDDSDGEDVIEIIEIEKEMEPEKNDAKSNGTEESEKQVDIAPIDEKSVQQVDKNTGSIAMKAETSVDVQSVSVEKANAEKQEEGEEEEEIEVEVEEEEEEEEEEQKKEETGEKTRQSIEQCAEIVDNQKQIHDSNDTAPIKEEESATKSAGDDTSVEAVNENNTSIPPEKSDKYEEKQEQTISNQDTEVYVSKKLAEMELTEDTKSHDVKNQETMTNVNNFQASIAIEPVSVNAPNFHRESIRSQLQEIVSDIDRAVEENQQFMNTSNMSSTITSQNNPNTEFYKQNSNNTIINPPSYFYQEDRTPSTALPSTKAIDLKKIFTPANDAEEIVPHKNRKLYASSAFFTPGLHPTVEDQVELARRISSSLSDANNKLSKGQSMYVNRKKRSVKWIHEGEGKNENVNLNGYSDQKASAQQFGNQTYHESKIPLKLVMDPRGVLQDVHTQGITFDQNSGMLSPDKCAELVSALHTDSPKGKGAELFAKRRKRSEKWIVDETTRSANNPTCTSYSAGPAPIYDTNQFSYIEQQPWGNAREAPPKNDFAGENNYMSTNNSYNQDYQTLPYTLPKHTAQPLRRNPNNQRDLAYKPSVPQGWNAPPANLPNELFTPPEIPLSGYTPPETDVYLPKSPQTTSPYYPHQQDNLHTSTDFYHQRSSSYYPSTELYQHQSEVAPSFKNVQLSQIYSKNPVPNFTPKPFTPSPIAHEKLAVFELNKSDQPPASVFRRPLTTPNQTTRNMMRNSLGFNASYDNNQNTTWHCSNDHNKFNRLSASSAVTLPENYNSSNLSMKNSGYNRDVSYQENHNRAARGWGHSNDFYRPISFTKQQPVELPYTDF